MNTEDRVREVFEQVARLVALKNADYRDAWRQQGWRGNLSRVLEKANRLRNTVWLPGQEARVNEGAVETAMDMIATLAFFVINTKDGLQWGNEFEALGNTPIFNSVASSGNGNTAKVKSLAPELAVGNGGGGAGSEQAVVSRGTPSSKAPRT